MRMKIYRVLIALASLVLVMSCEPSTFIGLEIVVKPGNPSDRPENDRDYNDEKRNVMLLYSAGFNSLSEYLAEDMDDLLKGNLPSMGRMNDILLIYSHLTSKKGAYGVDTSPVLMRVYKDEKSMVVKDTLVVYPAGVRSATAAQLNEVLTYVKDHYEANSYGMIFSSHATGYLPSGYYTNHAGYVYTPSVSMRDSGRWTCRWSAVCGT